MGEPHRRETGELFDEAGEVRHAPAVAAQEYVEEAPAHAEARRYLDQAFASEEEYEFEKALEECDTAIRLDPSLADAYNLRGVILEELGRESEAVLAYREALRLDPGIAAKIRAVESMGGALYVPGNVAFDESNRQNRESEWNIWVDPLAASDVFASGIPIRLTPLDATNKITWKNSDADMWKSESAPEGVLAAKLLQWMLSSMSRNGVYVWDLVAAVNVVEPDLCEHQQVHVQVVTRSGDQEGRTIIDKAAPPNAMVCISPNEDGIKRHVAKIFSRP